MNPGETPEICLHRGVHEEIGITDIEIIQYGGAVEHADGDRKWIVHPYLCRIKSGNIILNKEHTEFRWAHPTVLATEECIPPLKKDLHVLLGIEV